MRRPILFLSLIIIFVYFVSPMFGAITFVSSEIATCDGDNCTSTVTLDTTGANLLVVVAHSFYAESSIGSDSKNATGDWAACGATSAHASGSRVRIWYLKNPVVGTSHAIGVVGSYGQATVGAFAGADITAPCDQTSGANATDTTLAPGSVTPTTDGQVAVTGITGFSYDGFTVPSGYTRLETIFSVDSAYLIQTSATATNPSWVNATSSAMAAVVATFKAARRRQASVVHSARIMGGGGAASPPVGSISIYPGTSIQSVADANPVDSVFYIRSGTHREQSVAAKNGQQFIGETGAILSGAKVLSSWSVVGSTWKATGQTQEFAVDGAAYCYTGHPRCAYTEDVFFDGVPLLHVATVGEVGPGKFFFDYAADEIFIGDDPAGHTVEASTVQEAFYGGAAGIHIKNLIIEKYASKSQYGAINATTGGGINWLVEDNEIRYNHAGGIRLYSGMVVLNNHVHHNGQIGILGGGTGILVQGNQISYNNDTAIGYLYDWEAGGTKFANCADLTVRSNNVHHNLGPGLWTDINNYNVLYEYNTVADNVIGIFHEISYNAIIRYNTVTHNGYNLYAGSGSDLWYTAGILVSASPNVEVHNNTVVGNTNSIGAIQHNRGTGNRGAYELRNLNIHHNYVEHTSGIAMGISIAPGYGFEAVYTSWGTVIDYNTYKLGDNDRQAYPWLDLTPYRTRTQWQGYGLDTNGTWQ